MSTLLTPLKYYTVFFRIQVTKQETVPSSLGVLTKKYVSTDSH